MTSKVRAPAKGVCTMKTVNRTCCRWVQNNEQPTRVLHSLSKQKNSRRAKRLKANTPLNSHTTSWPVPRFIKIFEIKIHWLEKQSDSRRKDPAHCKDYNWWCVRYLSFLNRSHGYFLESLYKVAKGQPDSSESIGHGNQIIDIIETDVLSSHPVRVDNMTECWPHLL